MSKSSYCKGHILLLAAFLFTAPLVSPVAPITAAEGATWVLITRSNGGNDLHYIDTENIHWKSTHVVSTPSKVEKELPEVFGTRFLKRMTGVEEWHCGERKSRSLFLTMHFTDGTRLSDYPPTDWNIIVPKTVEEAIWEFLCQ